MWHLCGQIDVAGKIVGRLTVSLSLSLSLSLCSLSFNPTEQRHSIFQVPRKSSLKMTSTRGNILVWNIYKKKNLKCGNNH